MNKKQRIMLVRILVSAALLIALNFIPVTGVCGLCCIWFRIWSSATTF